MVPRLIRSGRQALCLQSYFTAGPKEVRAWTIMQGTAAPQAAGVIHTDFERGFIKAEVCAFNDFKALHEGAASMAKVKEAGKYRQEGKQYVMQDGDIVGTYICIKRCTTLLLVYDLCCSVSSQTFPPCRSIHAQYDYWKEKIVHLDMQKKVNLKEPNSLLTSYVSPYSSIPNLLGFAFLASPGEDFIRPFYSLRVVEVFFHHAIKFVHHIVVFFIHYNLSF
jgi:hypothetical protein